MDRRSIVKHYYADAVHNCYRQAREASYYLKLDRVSDDFLTKFTEAMREKPRVHSVDTFVHTYKLQHVDAVVPSTKTLYNYIHQGLLEIKVIDLPIGKSIEEGQKRSIIAPVLEIGKSILFWGERQ